ncbi:hypothetical protein G9A89_019454 [Geosiphon pyriformis]|nr:hypothetical protein G9A89_019454 [Geosiphon pyriformis]
MSKKKASKSAFHGPAGGSFSQKKKVVLKNIKHSGNKKDISLSRSELSDNVFSNVDSLFGDKKGANMTDINVGSFLGSAANTLKVKCVNTGAVFGSPLGFPNFDINDNKEVSLPFFNLKIVKTQMEVSVKKLFALDINLSAIEGKLAMTKTQIIRNFFSTINDHPIYLYFKKSMKMAALLAKEKEINVNNDFKKQEIHSNWTVSIKIQLIRIWQKAVMEFAKLGQAEQLCMWLWPWKIRILEYLGITLETTAHDLGTLLEGAGGKTCIINYSLNSGNWVCCAMVGFGSEKNLEFVYHTELIFGSVKLFWTRLNLVCYRNCECFGHSAMKCDVSTTPNAKFLRFIKKKSVPISCPAAFVSIVSPFGGSYFSSGSGSGFFSLGVIHNKGNTLNSHNYSSINNCLASLECSLELLADQVSDVLHRLNGMELVFLVPVLKVRHLNISILELSILDADMILDILQPFLLPLSSKIEEKTVDLGLNSLKVLTSKVGELESKMIALKIMDKFDDVWVFTTGLDIPSQLVSVCLLFKNKLLVMILGLYAGVVNSSSFVILDETNPFVVGPAAIISGPSVKRRSARVLTTGSVGGSSGHKIKKLLSGTKLSSSGATLKSGGSGHVVGQFNGMDTDGEASEAKHFNYGATVGFINYDIKEEEKVSLFSCKFFSLDKVWVDPKIIKTQVKVTVKKSFTLDINLLAIEEKLATAKTQIIRKLFSGINSFGRATTPSKFEGIIKSTFTSKESMERAVSLARKKGIIINSNLKRQGIRSDQAIVIKKIPMDTPKNMIITAVAEFGEIKLIRVQLIGLWQKTVVEFAKSEQTVQLASKWSFLIGKDLVRVTMAVRNRKTWASRDWFRALLFTLPVGTTAHDLDNLLKEADGKTCIINRSFEMGNRVRCAVVGFDFEEKLEAAFCMEPIFGGVKLSWARLDLVRCEKCGRFEHLALECNASDVSVLALSIALKKGRHVFSMNCFHLAKLYAKKNVPISQSAAFGDKSWAQMVSLAFFAGGSPSGSGFGFGFSLSGASGLVGGAFSSPIDRSLLDAQLAFLERSLELLADQVSGILRKLNFVELVPMVPSSDTFSLVGSVPVAPVLDSNMVLDGALTLPSPPPSNAELDVGFSSSSSKVLTTKVGGLESKMLALEASVSSVLAKLDLFGLIWKFATCNVCRINVPAKQEDVIRWHHNSGNLIADKFDEVRIFSSGLDKGFVGTGVVIIMNSSLVRHVSKIEEIPGRVILVCLLFKGKLLVTVLGLYAGASLGVCFRQAFKVNSFIVKAVNASNFVVLGGDFNENESERSVSYGFCLGFGLVNSLAGHQLTKASMWSNLREIEKTIDYILVSENLFSAVVKHWVGSVSEFFDTDHKAVMVSVGLGRFLDVQLNSLRKQANKNCWKFKVKDADASKWSEFRDCVSAKLLLIKDLFSDAKAGGDLNTMWTILGKVMVESADEIFSRQWFSEFQCSKNKHFSKFFGLKLLVAKIVGVVCAGNVLESTLDEAKACTFSNLVRLDVSSMVLLKYLSSSRKEYRKLKMFESRLAEEVSIRRAVERHMESFAFNKESMIRNVLDRPFRKVILDYLVINDGLVLESVEIKSKIDEIMVEWTRKQVVPTVVSELWARQYVSLDHIRDDAFSGVMHEIGLGELLSVVGSLPNSKAAGLFGIPNKL